MEILEKNSLPMDELANKFSDELNQESAHKFVESLSDGLEKVCHLSHALFTFLLENDSDFNFEQQLGGCEKSETNHLSIIWTGDELKITPKLGDMFFEFNTEKFLVKEKESMDILFFIPFHEEETEIPF